MHANVLRAGRVGAHLGQAAGVVEAELAGRASAASTGELTARAAAT